MSSFKTLPEIRSGDRFREWSSTPQADSSRTSGTGASDLDELTRIIDHATIMIVNDEPTTIRVVQRHLMDAGFKHFVVTNNPGEAISMVSWERPNLVLLDLMMPVIDGLEILGAIRKDAEVADTPVIFLTAGTDRAMRLSALKLGATDFLQKPVNPSELAVRIRNILMVKAYQDQLKNYSRTLEAAVQARIVNVEHSRRDVIRCLARAAEYRDDNVGHHVRRVGMYARIIGAELGFNEADLDILEQAAQLHDVGKIGISDEILMKPDRLTPEEIEQSKQHVEIGARILGSGDSPVLRMAAGIALSHHERWDGTGYPSGLTEEEIPLEGRITAIADVFDAISSKRTYKPTFPLDECFKIMEEGRATHFDPRILDAFLRRREEVVQVRIVYADVD